MSPLKKSLIFVFLAFVAGCATNPYPPRAARNTLDARELREARNKDLSLEKRAGYYLEIAADAVPILGPGVGEEVPHYFYNTAAAELTVLLHDAEGDRLWNRPLKITVNGATYRLRFAAGARDNIWAPAYFTELKLASTISGRTLRAKNRQWGVGGALVGVRQENPRESFAQAAGVTAPVTATLDFNGGDAILTLRDPTSKPAATVAGAVRPLEADFSAPIAAFPTGNEMITGFMAALEVNRYLSKTGLYLLQPFDPNRIPLIYVHGLISTPAMWRNVINEVQSDPDLRRHYQPWIFSYASGLPIAYSALRLREELSKARRYFGLRHGFVLVGHSMGGVVSRMQATSFDRAAWDTLGAKKAKRIFSQVRPGSLVYRAFIFDANPDLRRLIFICTPHRGSALALGTLGELGAHLFALPASLAAEFTHDLGDALTLITGSARQMPNSVTSLSPRNPTLLVLDKVPIRAPHHSIIGDRGRDDSPNSSDGVVAYWSSHLESAESELIVPGPHVAHEMTPTIGEIRRILHLDLVAPRRAYESKVRRERLIPVKAAGEISQ
jgi:pimeloyl-ACP methyl ester carboxylesterase